MARELDPSKQKSEHPAVTLNKKFEATKKRVGELERANRQEDKEEIEKLHREALDLLQQMKELDEKSVKNIMNGYERNKKSLESELEPIINEAEEVIDDAEAEELAIRELLVEYDAEDADIDRKIVELKNKNKKKTKTEKAETKRKKKEDTAETNAGNAFVTEPAEDAPKRTNLSEEKNEPEDKEAKEEPVAQEVVENQNIEENKYALAKEVEGFFQEFDIDHTLMAEFENLTPAQQFKTIRDLKQRIVEIVKQDAKNIYSVNIKAEKNRSNIFGKFLIGARELIQKERNIKNTEQERFGDIKNSEEGKKIVSEQMKLLAEINGSQDITVGENGELLVDYSKVLKIEETGTEGKQARDLYNIAANTFRSIPYEWSQGKEDSKERMAYEDAKARYEEAVGRVLSMKRIMGYKNDQAVKDMLEVKNSLMLEQILNTHPEIEIEFGKLAEGAGKEQVWKTIRRLAGVENSQKVGLFAAGYAARTITKATLGAIAMPIVGAVFGGLRAKFKAKETLVERRKDARYGGRDNSNEAEKVVDADKMANHIDNILNQLEQVNISDEKRLALEKRLQIRIDVALEKIEKGLLNFGNSKDALLNQYRLTENLNRALVRSTLFDETVREEVSARTNAIMSFREGNIAKAQQKYIEEQILIGAVRGAGIATAGYIVRAIGEEAGWWGEQAPRELSRELSENSPAAQDKMNQSFYIDTEQKDEYERYVEQSESLYQNAKKYYESTLLTEDKAEQEVALENMKHAELELKHQQNLLAQIEEDYDANLKKFARVSEESNEGDINKTPDTASYTENHTVEKTPDTTAENINTTIYKKPLDTTNIAQENKEIPNGNTNNETTSKDSVITKEKSSVQKPFKSAAPDKKNNITKEIPETKTRTEAPTQNKIDRMLDLAVVKKGEGVTFAFKQQIDSDPALGQNLANQIGYTGKVGTPDFYKALGEKFGYINEKGEWIGVKGSGGDTAYQFEKQGDAYVVNEYHKEGSAWVKGESHAVGGKFEGNEYEKKYEYFGKNKINSNRENPSGILKPEKIEHASDLPRPEKIEDTSGQFDRAPQKVGDADNGQLARATPEKPKTEIKKISSSEYWAKQNGNQKIEAGADSDLYGGKKDVKWGVAPGPDGAPLGGRRLYSRRRQIYQTLC